MLRELPTIVPCAFVSAGSESATKLESVSEATLLVLWAFEKEPHSIKDNIAIVMQILGRFRCWSTFR